MKMFTRIAPTPSGYLHTGNIFSFLLTREIADQLNGKVLLRIDDLDALRCKEVYIQDIFETIRFLQIRYEQGPASPEDFYLNYSQQIRTENYNLFLQLPAIKEMVFACACSRKDLSGKPETSKRKCNCRDKSIPLLSANVSWKIHVPGDTIIKVPDVFKGIVEINLFEAMGDFVVRRRDGIASYQVSSLVDDLQFGINYIVRGNDLLDSTAAQLYLAKIAGAEEFSSCKFLHHPLLPGPDGKKLSKSGGSMSVRKMREMGYTRKEILNSLRKSMLDFLNTAG